MGKLSDEQIKDAGLDGWRGSSAGIYATYSTGDFNGGVRFVQAVADAADAADHHPDVLLTYPSVQLRLVSHDVGAVTDRDTRLATKIAEIAAAQGIAATAGAEDLERAYGVANG